MAFIVAPCPTCRADSMTFHAHSLTASKGMYVMTSFCPSCHGPFVAWLNHRGSGPSSPDTLRAQNQPLDSLLALIKTLPVPQATTAPDNLPQGIERVFLQAEENRKRQHFDAAGMAYRRSLELAVQALDPNAKGTLAKRIDDLAANGKLTGEVRTWAHSIRTLGNEAAHDEAEPSAEDIEDLSEFARVVLEYLYTLPERVKKHTRPAASPPSSPAKPPDPPGLPR